MRGECAGRVNSMAKAECGSRADLFQAGLFQADLYQLDLFQLDLYQLDLFQLDLFQLGLVRFDLVRAGPAVEKKAGFARAPRLIDSASEFEPVP